ncbi:MAG: phosphodiesterase [Oscillospiraceae bacterium]|nr:phosphodiesterase [Oscillospiraceae bacterium]
MKLMFASDIHGSLYYAEKMRDAYRKENADKLILLGDLLYHGPRNDLPENYEPKKVIELLNSMKDEILCVRGNCDTEVDQMVLDFPIMADYAVIYVDGKMMYLTHGHKFNPENPPKLRKGGYLINGHTHIPAQTDMDDFIYINPGSVSIPKNGSAHTYMIYENGEFILKEL